MIRLPTVDLVVCEGCDPEKSVVALKRTCRGLWFRRVLWFSLYVPAQIRHLVSDFHFFRADYEQWNRFMTKELYRFIPNGHCLFIHDDGYVLNPEAWTDEFLQYDYLGAPWWYDEGRNVGNGGFSLRSKRYLDITSESDLDVYAPEDHLQIRVGGDRLTERGIKFAPESLASRFSLEANSKFGSVWAGQFGFHNTDITDISAYAE